MNFRSGAILLIIFLSMGATQALDSAGEAEQTWGGEGDYLSGAGSSIVYSFTTGTGSGDPGFQYSRYFEYYYSGDDAPPDDVQSFEIVGNKPSQIFFGGETVPYADYESYSVYTGANSLWIEGQTTWTQYAACPLGTWLQLVTIASVGGMADFYKITPSGRVEVNQHWLTDYNRLGFHAEERGRYFLYFVVDDRPSNLVIVDVGDGWPYGTTPAPSPGLTPPTTPTPTPPTPPAPTPSTGDVSVTIKSQGMRGYDVYVDDVYVGKEGRGGDPLDGVYSLKVVGNQWHTVKVYDGEWFYGKPKYYSRGTKYTLNVEPATTVYVYGGR